jgi:plasmid stabilization system protein ParE
MNQYRVSDEARADLDEIWFYIAQDNPDAADKFIRAIVSRFPKFTAMPYLGGRVKNYRRTCEVFQSVATSSFIVRRKKALKSPAYWMARGISRCCLNNAAMEADLTKAYNQEILYELRRELPAPAKDVAPRLLDDV